MRQRQQQLLQSLDQQHDPQTRKPKIFTTKSSNVLVKHHHFSLSLSSSVSSTVSSTTRLLNWYYLLINLSILNLVVQVSNAHLIFGAGAVSGSQIPTIESSRRRQQINKYSTTSTRMNAAIPTTTTTTARAGMENPSSSAAAATKLTRRFLFDSPFLVSPSPSSSSSSPRSIETNTEDTTTINPIGVVTTPPSTKPKPNKKAALIILNSPIQNPPSPIFNRLWDVSQFHVCADGGANRLHNATTTSTSTTTSTITKTTTTTKQYIPDMIRGDLDSLRPDVSSFYRTAGTTIECVPDQNSCDLDKALHAVQNWIAGSSSTNDDDNDDINGNDTDTVVYIYGAFGGRFDHEISSINVLYRYAAIFRNRLILYDDENFALLLPADTRNEIRLPLLPPSSFTTTAKNDGDGDTDGTSTSGCPPTTIGEGPTCGLIPFGCRCDTIQTTGLQWDLGGDGLSSSEFGGLVSTSNRVVGEVVTVQTSHPLLFTAEMRCPSRKNR